MKKFKVCTGIGDNIWVFQKLINSGQKFEFEIPSTQPQRSKQIFDLLPSIGTARYSNIRNIDAINKTCSTNRTNFHSLVDRDYYLSFNTHLEQGYRIEKVFPDLKTSYKINFDTESQALTASKLLFSNAQYFGIYTSKHGNVKHWGGWNLKDWFYFCTSMYAEFPELHFVIIGAEYDGDLSRDLSKKLSEKNIPHTMLIGENLALVVEIMKRLRYFVGFPSGLSVLANVGADTESLMFYPSHLSKMIDTWASIDDIESGYYKGMLFPRVNTAIEYVKGRLS